MLGRQNIGLRCERSFAAKLAISMVLLPHVSWSAMPIPLSSSISTPPPEVLKQLSKPIG